MSFWHIKCASLSVRSGGVIAYPTEAVYGLGCSPWDASAVARILDLKQRNINKGLIVLAADVSQLDPLVELSSDIVTGSVLATWPGSVTWILPARQQVPTWLTGKQDGIAVRVSAHPVVRRLCKSAGLLVSTSANRANTVPATTPSRVRAYFGNGIDYIVPGAVGPLRKPTEIRHAALNKLVRSGT